MFPSTPETIDVHMLITNPSSYERSLALAELQLATWTMR